VNSTKRSSSLDQRFLNFRSTGNLRDVEGSSRIIVVDDDEGVRTTVTWALEAEGFDVHAVADGVAALEAIQDSTPSLVVLDLALPGLGGLDVLRELRRGEDLAGRRPVPVIILSGRGGETDRIVGLDLGADDYLVKPFSPAELAARARSVLRRSGSNTVQAPFLPKGSGVEVDRTARLAWVDGEPIELAAKEFDLLVYFLEHPGRACSRDELLSSVWASSSGWQNEATVTEHVYRLRLKVEPDPQRPTRLRTVRAFGYRWEG
jgi:two-component system, OmpR family, phosphate regulon response regulator PhoB